MLQSSIGYTWTSTLAHRMHSISVVHSPAGPTPARQSRECIGILALLSSQAVPAAGLAFRMGMMLPSPDVYTLDWSNGNIAHCCCRGAASFIELTALPNIMVSHI